MKQTFSIKETDELVKMISWAVNGCEHGVVTYDSWKTKCRELAEVLRSKGYAPHGQWASL